MGFSFGGNDTTFIAEQLAGTQPAAQAVDL